MSDVWRINTLASAQGFHPYVWIQTDAQDYNTIFTHMAHELMHVIGLGHSTNPGSLMAPEHARGQKWYATEDVFTGLTQFYGSIGGAV